MESTRKDAVFAGIALLLGWSGLATAILVPPLTGSGDFPRNLAGNEGRLVAGALAQMLMALSCSGIAVFFYPTLRRLSPSWALWSVFLRSFEAVFMLLAATFLLMIAELGRQAAAGGAEALAAFSPVALALRSGYGLSGGAVGTLGWSLGAIIYNVLFFRSRLIPRWLSVWGLVGAPVSVASCLSTILGSPLSDTAFGFLFQLAFGFQEIPLAVYLIAKGFRRIGGPGMEAGAGAAPAGRSG